MSLKQSAQLRTYEDPDTGETIVRDIVLKNVRFNYTYLESPRPKEFRGDGINYETNLIIEDSETWDVFAAYYQWVYERAVLNSWKNRRPGFDAMNVPFYVPTLDDKGNHRKFEENAVAIIKTKTNQQPELYIKVEGPLRKADERDEDQFYSGMIGDAIVSLWAYDKGGQIPKPGIKAYINGVSKTGIGEPVRFNTGNYDMVGAFGDETDVENADLINDAFGGSTVAQPTAPVAAPIATPVAPDLASILGKTTAPAAQPVAAPTAPVVPVAQPAAPAANPLAGLLTPSATVAPIAAPAAPVAAAQPAASSNDLLQSLINKGLHK